MTMLYICYFILGWMFSWIMSKNGMFVNLFCYLRDFLCSRHFFDYPIPWFSYYSKILNIFFTFSIIFPHFYFASDLYPLKLNDIEAIAFFWVLSLFNLSLYFFSIFELPTIYRNICMIWFFSGFYILDSESPSYISGISINSISWISIVSTIALNFKSF